MKRKHKRDIWDIFIIILEAIYVFGMVVLSFIGVSFVFKMFLLD